MTARSEEAKAELKEAEQKLADAKAELADTKVELARAEAKQEQVEQKLMETKHADPADTAEIQRLERKLQRVNVALEELELSVASKSASVRSKEEIIRRLESQRLAIAGPALASSVDEMKMQATKRRRLEDDSQRSKRLSLKVKETNLDEAMLTNPDHVLSLPYPSIDIRVPERVSVVYATHLHLRAFHFMGRERLTEVMKEMDTLSIGGKRLGDVRKKKQSAAAGCQQVLSAMLIYGSPGWGKSYLLAALVVLLLHEFFNGQSELRVVYIPDCSLLLADFFEELQRSLLLAFAEDAQSCQTISEAKTADELVNFLKDCEYGSLLFVVDQFNALTVHQIQGVPDPLVQKKVDATSLIASCSGAQFIIRAISINDENKALVEKKQTNQRMLRLDGELSEAEMQGWLKWQKTRLPKPDETEMTEQQVVDFMAVEAGRNMLFLNAFLNPFHDVSSPSASSSSSVPDWTLSQALVAFHNVKEVKAIDKSLRAVLNRLQEVNGGYRVKESLQFMLQCVSRSVVSNTMPDLYDARYFYVTSGASLKIASAAAASQIHQRTPSKVVGHTIAHIVDRHVARLVREYHHAKLLTEQFWTVSTTDHAHNPIMLGFLVEQAVLSYLSDDLLLRTMLQGVVTMPTDARPSVQLFEEGSETSALRAEEAIVLYIPKSFNYPAVDAVLRVIERTGPAAPVIAVKKQPSRASKHPQLPVVPTAPTPVKVTVTIIPIQITMRAVDDAKRRKSLRFFDNRDRWTSDHSDADIHYVFAFIGGAAGMQKEDKKDQKEGDLSFRELLLRLDEVSVHLAKTVRLAQAQIATRQQGT